MARAQRQPQLGVRGHAVVERSQIERGRGVAEREVPAESPGNSFSRGHVAVPAATGTDRDFWISAEALRAIDAYRASERAAAVHRARRQGRYDDLRDITVVSPELVSPDQLSVGDRRRLFIEGDGGLEPASLWLTDSGTPMNQVSWEQVFVAANARCASAGVEVHCHPHMLRHSFAFRIIDAYLASQGIAAGASLHAGTDAPRPPQPPDDAPDLFQSRSGGALALQGGAP